MNQPILVVEDDEPIREFVAETLKDRGYAVIAVDSGMAAVTAVARQNPVLIILDIEVPIMAGCSFLQVYNRLPEPRAPVIAMVTGDDTFERAVVRSVKGYLDKPFDAGELVRIVERNLPKPVRMAAKLARTQEHRKVLA